MVESLFGKQTRNKAEPVPAGDLGCDFKQVLGSRNGTQVVLATVLVVVTYHQVIVTYVGYLSTDDPKTMQPVDLCLV